MQKENYIQWIIAWFGEKTGIIQPDFNADFFSNGSLNSFQTLELVFDIETSLKLSIPDSALTDPRFSTINGLADILQEISHVK